MTAGPPPGGLRAALREVRWIHGAPPGAPDGDPLLQTHAIDPDTWVLRVSKGWSFEANFIYLLIGRDRAVLFDTGGPPDDPAEARRLPLRETVDAILAGRGVEELVVAHGHSHGDHVWGDHQFADRPRTAVVGHDLGAVRAFWGLDWPPDSPDARAGFELGDRRLELFPIPGHEKAHVAVHDPRTGALLSGDILYPGLITVRDWPAFRASAARLARFVRATPVSAVLGNHVEMSRTPGVLYPLGARWQPDEHPLPLGPEHVEELHAVCEGLGEAPREVVRASFAIRPVAG